MYPCAERLGKLYRVGQLQERASRRRRRVLVGPGLRNGARDSVRTQPADGVRALAHSGLRVGGEDPNRTGLPA